MGGLDGQKMGNILSEVDTPGTRVPVDIIGKLLALSFQRVSFDFPTNKQTNKQTDGQTNSMKVYTIGKSLALSFQHFTSQQTSSPFHLIWDDDKDPHVPADHNDDDSGDDHNDDDSG